MTETDFIIHTYTRREAIADGVLIDVTKTAKEAGLRLPVAITAAVWSRCVAVPLGIESQDERGRLWDVLFMLFMAIRRGPASGPVLRYRLEVRKNLVGDSPPVELKSICGPNDEGRACLTVMLPEED